MNKAGKKDKKWMCISDFFLSKLKRWILQKDEGLQTRLERKLNSQNLQEESVNVD